MRTHRDQGDTQEPRGHTRTHRDHGDTRGHTGATGTHPVPAPGSAPGSGAGCCCLQGWAPLQGAALQLSPAERAEQCWEYQSGSLGAGGCTHSQGFHPPGSTAEPARGSALRWEGSASLCTAASTVRRAWGKPGRRERSGERVERSRHSCERSRKIWGGKGAAPQIQARKGQCWLQGHQAGERLRL